MKGARAAMTPTDELRIRFGRTLAGSSVVVAIAGLVVAAAVGRWDIAWLTLTPVNATIAIGFGALAWTVLPRQPRNGSVWAYTWAACFGGLYSACLAVLVLSAPAAVLDQGVDDMIPAELPWPAAVAVGAMAAVLAARVSPPAHARDSCCFPMAGCCRPRWRWAAGTRRSTLDAGGARDRRTQQPVEHPRLPPRPQGTFGDRRRDRDQPRGARRSCSALRRWSSATAAVDAIVRHQIRWICSAACSWS